MPYYSAEYSDSTRHIPTINTKNRKSAENRLLVLHACKKGSQYHSISMQKLIRIMHPLPELVIYRDNLPVIVVGDNLLPIIVIAQTSFNLSITDIALVIYFAIADKLSRLTILYAHSVQTSKLVSWRYGKNTRYPQKLVAIFKNLSLLCLMPWQSP